ncbi:hypothetical protein [Sorangium sp. So ce363]|uniref:hypothetical protein n=1 Tax=Sorangium sp. So ce363 TaxID=3133304 RepID=UPI003F61DFD5
MSDGASVVARRRDAGAIFALALAARLATVVWAAGRFPPTADGTYYQRIAERIAAGLGYTWLWPDGVVTYAAHYPVGYPGAVGALYALLGAHPAVAMLLNAVLGALAALAVHRLAARAAPRSRAVPALSGGLVALHPGLVAYTPALMTEGVTGSLVACAAWASARARERRPALAPFAVIGLLIGAATLVRPQALLLAPLFAGLALSGSPPAGGPRLLPPFAARAAPVLLAVIAALLVCAPWTARNCLRMNQCALVSVNGGWNLLIGADPASTGAWAPVQVPEACREVFDEAGKDACFGREARRYIAEHPGEWLGLVPRKLAATFDYCGAAGWYLHASNPSAFSEADKVALGAVETVFERVVLLAALVWAARRPAQAPGAARRPSLAQRALDIARLALFALGVVAALHVHAWVGYLALLGLALLKGRALLRAPVLVGAALAVLAATAATHAVFFGAGRYALVAFPLLSGLAALAAARQEADRPAAGAPRATTHMRAAPLAPPRGWGGGSSDDELL